MSTEKLAIHDEQLNQTSGGTLLPYRVKPGDSLAAIAEQYHVSVSDLARWNNIENPDILTVGQQLVIKY